MPGPWRLWVRLAGLGIGSIAALHGAAPLSADPALERADLSLPPLSSPPALSLQPGGGRVAEALAHYASALQFEASGNLREALVHFMAALERDPGNADLASRTAELAYSFQGRKEAIALLQRAVAARPADPAPYLNLARFCATYAPDDPFENDRVNQTLQTALNRFPERAEVRSFAVLTALMRGQRAEAAALLEKALKLEVKTPAFWLELARAAQKVWPLGEEQERDVHVPKVNAFYDRALALAAVPAGLRGGGAEAFSGSAVRLEVARYYLLSNQLQAAKDLCLQIVAKDAGEDALSARKLLVRLHEAFGEEGLSLAQQEAVVNLAPEDVEQRRMLARAYEMRDRYADAVPHLQAAIRQGGGDSEDYLHLGDLMLRSAQFEAAVELARRSVRLFPDQAMFHLQTALAERSLQHWDAAVQGFAEAEKMTLSGAGELNTPWFFFQYGMTLERAGKPDEAGRKLEKSITLTPGDDRETAASTMNYLGYMWLELDRNLEKAGELIRKANELVPDSAAYVDSLGWWHFKTGDYPQALKELQRALSLLPELKAEDAEIVEHVGRTYLKMNQPAKARAQFQKARDLMPPDEAVRKRIEEGLKAAGEKAKSVRPQTLP